MAYEELLQCVTMASSGDLSASQYKLVAPSSASAVGGMPRTSIVSTRGAFALGVLQDNTTQTGASVRVAVYGITKVLAGDSSGMDNAITFGTPIMASSVGRAVPTTLDIGTYVIGRGMGQLATGGNAIIPMLLTHQGMSSS